MGQHRWAPLLLLLASTTPCYAPRGARLKSSTRNGGAATDSELLAAAAAKPTEAETQARIQAGAPRELVRRNLAALGVLRAAAPK